MLQCKYPFSSSLKGFVTAHHSSVNTRVEGMMEFLSAEYQELCGSRKQLEDKNS